MARRISWEANTSAMGVNPTRSAGPLEYWLELEVTVLFSDIRGFSTFAEQVPPRQVA